MQERELKDNRFKWLGGISDPRFFTELKNELRQQAIKSRLRYEEIDEERLAGYAHVLLLYLLDVQMFGEASIEFKDDGSIKLHHPTVEGHSTG